MEGWVKIHRQIMDNVNYLSEPFCRNMAWIDLILLANHDENSFRCRGILVKVKRGQIGYTSENLAERWKWSRGKVLRYLTELQKSGQIVQQKNNVTTLISILNYEKYQHNSTTKDTANDTGFETTDSTTERQQTDTNKNDKNDKNIYNSITNEEILNFFSILKTKIDATEFSSTIQPQGEDYFLERLRETKLELSDKQFDTVKD